ncbi:MAG: transglutaminase family protein [Thaumarchaeota archaeon]|nr:transglutaminase family protein [Nitrososphaerota archaeon]
MSQDFDPIVADWISFAKNPTYTVVEKCLKLSQTLEYPDLSISNYVQKLHAMGEDLKNSLSEIKNATYLVSMLNEYMFDGLGFSGNSDDYYNPKNNFLNVVLDKKSGIPITLSIIYVEIAKYIGLDLRPVGFPSHFLVKFSEELILDPFNRGKLLSVDDLQEILDRSYGGSVKFLPDFLNEIGIEQILIRICRNLKNSYTQSFNYTMALHCINMILGIEPESPEEIRDKGVLESRQLKYELALRSLNRYLEIAPEADDVDYVLNLIRNIKEKFNQQ